MRNLFDSITNTLGQFTQQGQSNDRRDENKSSGSNFGKIGAMGLGGLLGALVDNPKHMGKTLKKAAMIGGGAALGGLAYGMYQKWRNQSSNQSGNTSSSQSGGQGGFGQGGFGQNQGGFGGGFAGSQGRGGFSPVLSGGFGTGAGAGGTGGFTPIGHGQGYGHRHGQKQVGYTSPMGSALPNNSRQPVPNQANPFEAYNSQQQIEPEVDSDALGDLLLEAMVFAARADNHIDANEQQMIMKVAQELNPSQDLMQKISTFLNEPLDPNALARKLPNPEMAPDLYRLSAAAIVSDTSSERQYLQALAQALNLSAQQVSILDQEAAQFRAQAVNC